MLPLEDRAAAASGAMGDPGAEPFSYSCRRCNRCCVGKRIQVNPYEVARLARGLELAGAETRRRFTAGGEGVTLDQRPDGACVFLGPEGCTVHPDRPLVCRLYPLGRHRLEDGTVSYSRVQLQPPPGGLFGTRGTVADYVEAQGAAPFIAAADAYFDFYCRAMRSLEASEGEEEPDGGLGADLLDLDETVERHCAETGEAAPTELDGRMRLHLRILFARLEDLGRGAKHASLSSGVSAAAGSLAA